MPAVAVPAGSQKSTRNGAGFIAASHCAMVAVQRIAQVGSREIQLCDRALYCSEPPLAPVVQVKHFVHWLE